MMELSSSLLQPSAEVQMTAHNTRAAEVFGTALDRGVSDERSRRALWHGARLLIASQQADGSWGKAHGARRALIAWRTFRRLEPVRE